MHLIYSLLGSTQLTTLQATSSPSTVGQTKATLSISGNTATLISSGGVIVIVAPTGTSLSSTKPSCTIQVGATTNYVTCTVVSQKLTLIVNFTISAGSSFVVNFIGGFSTPGSSAETASFTFQTYSSSALTTLLDYQTSGLTMVVAAASLTSMSITTAGTGEVGQKTMVTVSIKNTNSIPSGGQIQMVFPVWNSEANPTQQQQMVDTVDALSCAGVLLLSSSMTCTFATNTATANSATVAKQVLTITNAFSSAMSAGSTFSFTIQYITNPISLEPVSVTINTMTAAGDGIIDTGTTLYSATTQTSIPVSTAVVTSDNSTVQTYSNVQLTFYTPVPLNAGSIVTVYFPYEFTIDSNLNSVYGYGIFGSYRSLTYQVDTNTGSVQITDGCQSYRQSGISGVLIFQTVLNPSYVANTDSFQVYISNVNGYAVASLTTGLIFTPVYGSIYNVAITPASKAINSDSTFQIYFTPPHALSQNGRIIINLPSNVVGSCSLSSYSSQFQSTIACTSQSTTQFTFSTLYSSSGYSGKVALYLTFLNVELPGSVQSMTSLAIGTYETDGSSYYLVDYYQSSTTTTIFTLVCGEFLTATIDPGTKYTSTTSAFKFTFTTNNAIPSGGKFTLTIPPEVTITQSSMSCSGVANIQSTLKCALSFSNSVGTITITNAVSSSGIAASTIISFSISGFTTPSSTKTSSSFTFTSMDSSSYIIDQTTQYLTVTMTKGIPITNLQASSSSNIVGSSSTHTISFTSPVTISTGTQFYITIPSEVTPPASGLSCNGIALLSYTQYCTISGRIVTFSAQLSSTSATTLGQTISFKLGLIVNPSSTKPSSVYTMTVYDVNGYLMSQTATTSTQNAYIQMSLPDTIASYTFKALNLQQLATTSIILSFLNVQTMPQNGYITIKTTTSQMAPASGGLTCTSNIQSSPTCSYQLGTLTISNIFQKDYPSGSNVTLTINNMEILVTTPVTTTSWNLTTYTSEDYMIDRRDTGFNFTFGCTSPCLTCLTNKPASCLSCNTETTYTILYNGNCYSTCPSGTYFYSSLATCIPCSSTCLTCNYYNGDQCTSCNSNSLVPYLNGNTCSDKCAFGYYGDTTLKKCVQCTDPCASCTTGSSTACTTCDANSVNKYLFSNMCLSSCPSGYLVPTGSTDFTCQQCDPNCKECTGTSTTCTSCSNSNILSQYNSACVQSCQSDITVYSQSTNTCEVCNSSCSTCTKQTTFCSSCPTNLYLEEITGTCVGDCSANQTMIGVNGVCVDCSSNCITCQNSPDQCLKCIDTKYFYNYTCTNACPTGYVSNSNKHCILDGLNCPFGYEPNALGDACILSAQICETGFKLNLDKTRCVPEPGNYIPFPLILSCFFLSIIAVASKIKHKDSLLATNIVALISLIEVVGMLAQIVLSYIIGLRATFALTLLALIFHIGSNIFFTVIYLKQVKQDAAYKYWAQNYSITQTIIALIGGALNFKFFRMLYGRFFGKDNFNAPFEDPDSFFKPFTFISVFSLISTMLPLLVGNIIGLVFIEYGYQVFINCLEMTIIEVVILALSIYEYILLKKHLIKQNTYFKVGPKLLDRSQVNVMSTLMDDSTTSGYKFMKPTGQTANTLEATASGGTGAKPPQTYGEYYERRRLLEQLLNKLMGRNTGKKDNTTLALINELQEEEIMKGQMRNCRSFRDLRDYDQDFADKDAGDPELQNFISAPNSPREKEMLHNPFFQGRITELKKAFRMRDQLDNVYAEARPTHYFPLRDCKLISVKVQVNPMDLLGLDEFIIRDARQKRQQQDDVMDEGYVEENFGQEYTHGLINNVINGMDGEFKKRRRRLPKNRLKDIPNFDLSDIMGDFDIDDDGNHLIVKGAEGKLNDRIGSRVNNRGYLVDIEGNVVTKKGTLIFRRDEIDSDDEIPAPFCFEKKKESLFKVESMNDYNKKQKKTAVEDHDDEIEKEFKRLKQQNKSNRSSVESLMGETPSKYNGKNRKKFETDDDSFLTKIVQPMQAKSKNELIKAGGGNKGGATDLESQRTMDSRKGRGGFGINSNIKSSANKINDESTKHMLKQDTSINDDSSVNKSSAKDLFFSSLAKQQGANRSRPHPNNFGTGGQGTQSTNNQSRAGNTTTIPAQYNTSMDNPLYQLSADEEGGSRQVHLQRLREALGNTREDEILLKKLVNMENNYSMASTNKKTTLVNKNLAKVYGKIQDKYKEQMFHEPRTQDSMRDLFSGLEDNEVSVIQKNKQQRALGMGVGVKQMYDTKLKGLHQIYSTSNNVKRAQSTMSKNKIPQGPAKFRAMQNSLLDNGIDSSDQEEIKLRKELDKMKAILDKDSSSNTRKNFTSAKMKMSVSSQKHLVEGGWI